VLWHALEPALSVCDVVVAVVPEKLVGSLACELADKGVLVVGGGATRSESVRCGLRALADLLGESASLRTSDTPFDSRDVIVVHDAARPLATDEIFRNVILAVQDGADAAVPAIEVSDTIRHQSQGLIDRSSLRAVQTPQAFKAEKLWQAHLDSPDATDDATLVEAIGGEVELVQGDPVNLKLTHQMDLAVAETLLTERARSLK